MIQFAIAVARRPNGLVVHEHTSIRPLLPMVLTKRHSDVMLLCTNILTFQTSTSPLLLHHMQNISDALRILRVELHARIFRHPYAAATAFGDGLSRNCDDYLSVQASRRSEPP